MIGDGIVLDDAEAAADEADDKASVGTVVAMSNNSLFLPLNASIISCPTLASSVTAAAAAGAASAGSVHGIPCSISY